MADSIRGCSRAPLMLAVDVTAQVHLILDSNSLAAARCSKLLEAGAKVIVISPEKAQVHFSLQQRIDEGTVQHLCRDFEEHDLKSLGREEVDGVVDAVFITAGANNARNAHISSLCRRLRIPIKVVDAPELCTFALLSTYSDGPLHIGVTTSGRGCQLAARLRREISASLPSNLGAAIERLGTARRRILEEDRGADGTRDGFEAEEDDLTAQKHTFNALVTPEDASAAKSRRVRWLSQICEYWPLRRLAAVTDEDVDKILTAYTSGSKDPELLATRSDAPAQKKGRIVLAGSGPGHPDLLTRATHQAIKNADIILADKLVPAPVLDLIPRRTEVHIARKFPGNADKAQEELLSMGLEALRAGRRVLRLKQGDPYLYGRGAEEYDYFRGQGYTPVVLPGITSAMSAPLFAGIPPTHRSVSDQLLVCTGTGRKGAAPEPPSYIPTQTVVFLMALHRLSALVDSLILPPPAVDGQDPATLSRILWPKETPCAVIERASCPDQRIIRTTLEHVCLAVETEGSRPPGLLVVGASCGVLFKLGAKTWITEEGFRGLDELAGEPQMAIINELRADEPRTNGKH